MGAITDNEVPKFTVPQCVNCVHFDGWNGCAAFEVIPYEIFANEILHEEPLEIQTNQIVFEEKKK